MTVSVPGARVAKLRHHPSHLTFGPEPAQRCKAGEKTIFASPDDHERRKSSHKPAYRSFRNGEFLRAWCDAGYWIDVRFRADEFPIIHPCLLHELKLTA